MVIVRIRRPAPATPGRRRRTGRREPDGRRRPAASAAREEAARRGDAPRPARAGRPVRPVPARAAPERPAGRPRPAAAAPVDPPRRGSASSGCRWCRVVGLVMACSVAGRWGRRAGGGLGRLRGRGLRRGRLRRPDRLLRRRLRRLRRRASVSFGLGTDGPVAMEKASLRVAGTGVPRIFPSLSRRNAAEREGTMPRASARWASSAGALCGVDVVGRATPGCRTGRPTGSGAGRARRSPSPCSC